MASTQSGFGSDNPQPEPITMTGVQAMVRTMLGEQMEETKRLLQQSKDELIVPVLQASVLEATIRVAKSIEEMINDTTANKVEVGKKRKFEGSSRPNKSNISSKFGKRRDKGKWCGKCKNKHSGNCDGKVKCFKCGEIGHYANKCTIPKEVCYGCKEEGHISKNCQKNNEVTRPSAPSMPKEFQDILEEAINNTRK